MEVSSQRAELGHSLPHRAEVVRQVTEGDAGKVLVLPLVDVFHQLHVVVVLLVELRGVIVPEVVPKWDEDHVVREERPSPTVLLQQQLRPTLDVTLVYRRVVDTELVVLPGHVSEVVPEAGLWVG